MSKLYDLIIIGGGPSGSTMATVMARKGFDVLVLEKEKFPREHVGESLLPFMYQIFEELGVLDQMKARFSRKPGVTFSNIDGSSASHWCFKHVIKDESSLSFHVRRAHFDELLLNNSRDNGAEVQEETTVSKVDLTNPQQVKIYAERHGEQLCFEGRFLVDASGQQTMLANQLKNKLPFTSLQPRVAFSTHWKGAALSPDLAAGNIKIVHLEGEKMGWFWMIPLLDDRLSVGVALNMDYSKKERRRLSPSTDDWQTALYLEELQASPVAQAILQNAERYEPVVANGDFSYYAAEKWGANYAIIGDAAGFLDPIFSSGIYLGMKSALLVGDGIEQMLNTGEQQVIKKAYGDIAGAYTLVEKLINTFYEPGSIKFNEADKAFNLSFEKFETAYSILHLILAGDFFTHYEKYIKALEMLRDPQKIAKYKHLIGHDQVDQVSTVCTAAAVEQPV